MINSDRYIRHLSLPDFGLAQQEKLNRAHILMVGAGGLGAAALPYLAGAGIGRITIADDDTISLHNLHRQPIYKTSEIGQSKAQSAAQYLKNLNPDIKVDTITARLYAKDPVIAKKSFDLILDGSDNFATKRYLNEFSVSHCFPLITASVNQHRGQCGIFAGYKADAPCYACLFPALPSEARNCNDAGVLGTAAGLTGLYQAHLAILYLTGFSDSTAGTWLECDFKTLRVQKILVPKDKRCQVCNGATHTAPSSRPQKKEQASMIEIIPYETLKKLNPFIIDVRTPPEIQADPVTSTVQIELSQIPLRYHELPKDRLLAFVCAGNIRSMKAAQYLQNIGYGQKVCVLDKFSL